MIGRSHWLDDVFSEGGEGSQARGICVEVVAEEFGVTADKLLLL